MPDDKLELTELHPAWVYDCIQCGRENWERSVTQYMDPDNDDDREAVRAVYGDEVLERMTEDRNHVVSCQSHPRTVTCRHCGTRFRAVGPGAVIDDDDDDDGAADIERRAEPDF